MELVYKRKADCLVLEEKWWRSCTLLACGDIFGDEEARRCSRGKWLRLQRGRAIEEEEVLAGA